MAKIINVVKEGLEQVMSKYSSGGYLSPTEFDNYARIAQIEKLTDELDNALDSSVKTASLSGFKTEPSSFSVTSGKLTKPDDFLAFETAVFNDYSSGSMYAAPFEELTNDKFTFRKGSALEAPSEEFPALTVRDTYLDVLPKSIGSVMLVYIKVPPKPEWNTTLVNNRRVYDETTSVDFLFGEDDIPNLVFRMARLLGIEISAQETYQMVAAETQNKE